GDLAHQRLALEPLEARHELLLDRLRAREGRVAGGLDRPLERRVDLHDGLEQPAVLLLDTAAQRRKRGHGLGGQLVPDEAGLELARLADRKSTRLNSSHGSISYAVFCLKKKKQKKRTYTEA